MKSSVTSLTCLWCFLRFRAKWCDSPAKLPPLRCLTVPCIQQRVWLRDSLRRLNPPLWTERQILVWTRGISVRFQTFPERSSERCTWSLTLKNDAQIPLLPPALASQTVYYSPLSRGRGPHGHFLAARFILHVRLLAPGALFLCGAAVRSALVWVFKLRNNRESREATVSFITQLCRFFFFKQKNPALNRHMA